MQFVRVWDQIEPSIYSVEGLQRGDGDGGIDISEDKSNHLLIKPSTSRLLFSVGQGGTSDTDQLYMNRATKVLMKAMHCAG